MSPKIQRNFQIYISVPLRISLGKSTLCITASGNILAGGSISVKLFMAPLEAIELLTFWYVVAERHIAQL